MESRDEIPASVERTSLLDNEELPSTRDNRIVERRLEHGDTVHCVGVTERGGTRDPPLPGRGRPHDALQPSREAFESDHSIAGAVAFVLVGSVFAFVCFTHVLPRLGPV
jgi:hypothetical protein